MRVFVLNLPSPCPPLLTATAVIRRREGRARACARVLFETLPVGIGLSTPSASAAWLRSSGFWAWKNSVSARGCVHTSVVPPCATARV